jgi:hypothetical protein
MTDPNGHPLAVDAVTVGDSGTTPLASSGSEPGGLIATTTIATTTIAAASPVAVCRCEGFDHPHWIVNLPGLDAIEYRVGDFRTFRHALLLSRPDEVAIRGWRPGPGQDLALQMVEWWAILADILTFYNERIANESFIRTAVLPESVDGLIRLLGYRPRPAIGATGTVAMLLSGSGPVTVPAGFQIQSKPGPGKKPQTFETESPIVLGQPDAVPVEVRSDGRLVRVRDGVSSILVAGRVSGVEVGDRLLIAPRAGGSGAVWARVSAITTERDVHDRANTRFAFSGSIGLTTALARDYRIVRSTLAVRPWSYATDAGLTITASTIDLDSVQRTVRTGDPVVLDAPGTTLTPAVATVSAYAEVIWFANAASATPAVAPTTPTNVIPLPILHTRLTFGAPLPNLSGFDAAKSSVLVRTGWVDVGRPIPAPVSSLPAGVSAVTLDSDADHPFPPTGVGIPMLLEDRDGIGIAATASGTAGSVGLASIRGQTRAMAGPFRALFDLVPVSRGSTVLGEVLGSGDATAAGQRFTLKKAPLTYLADVSGSSGIGYRSTLRVWVDGIEWTEVANFYRQPPTARVFVTHDTVDELTIVEFGDGVNGSRLPSGPGNVVASYRYEAGADNPAPGSLTTIAKALPKLKAIRNPVAVGGGSDRDAASKIRRLAPRSVLTFGRAVSADDYEVIAASAPGVGRASASWAFDTATQRTLVTVWVGDDEAAATSARLAFRSAGDPNRPVVVRLATAIAATLRLSVVVDPSRAPGPVRTAVTQALVDPDRGLFGTAGIRIGGAIFASAIAAACLDVPGVVAIHELAFTEDRGAGPVANPGPVFDPGQGAFYRIPASAVTVS